ncbi:metallophosphoesterase [Sphingosinicella terrae]|uniref:metallophosphoesterase n=1 Tax=Sphingosinicella terrae TaxID=2172047 RepID=UPI000E0DF8DD|nr:metallophosphoesterase [Sphingosinicella terrae]
MPLFTIRRLLLLLLVAVLAFVAWCYRNATARPVIREASVMLPRWPAGQPPIRLLLLSDVHVAAPDMTPSRLAEIVWQIEAASPDIVLIAGDLVSDRRIATGHYSLRQAVAPFERLRPRLGVFAVLGNHDHWRDSREATEALEAVGVRLLDNEAVRAGPLAIGGLDDAFTGHDDLQATLEAMSRAGGARVLLSHSPDPFAELPSGTGLMLAGHTHCGQIRLPLYGAISTMSDHGERYACGRVDERDNSLIVTSGVGTSIMPLRLGAPPDMWLITVGPEAR